MELKIEHPSKGLWVLYDEGINLYLVAGDSRAVLIDSGFGFYPELKDTAEKLCGLPVALIHTHAHGDHINGDQGWSEAWLHPAEWDSYRETRKEEALPLRTLEDGTLIALGGRTLETIHVPGHSPGSVAFLDRENRILFSGDTLMMQPVFLMFPTSSPTDYLASLRRLEARAGEFDLVYPSHNRFPIAPQEAIADLLDCAERAAAGDRDSIITFELDLVVAVAKFEGYGKGNYRVGTKEIGGAPIPGVES